jgi:hypothetical protein
MLLRDLNSHRANTDHLPLVGHYPHVLQVDFNLLTLDPSLLQARLIRIRYSYLWSDVN